MKVQDLLEELEEKKEYKEFKKEHPDSYFSAAFLILDLEKNTEEIQLDFYLPTLNKIAAFEFPFSKPKIHEEIISIQNKKTVPTKPTPMKRQTTSIKIDIDDLEKKSTELIEIYNSNIKPKKIIAILMKDIWNLTCMDNMLGIVRIKINAITEELLDFNKGGLMDFMGIRKNDK
jgi:hypothetical protein